MLSTRTSDCVGTSQLLTFSLFRQKHWKWQSLHVCEWRLVQRDRTARHACGILGFVFSPFAVMFVPHRWLIRHRRASWCWPLAVVGIPRRDDAGWLCGRAHALELRPGRTADTESLHIVSLDTMHSCDAFIAKGGTGLFCIATCLFSMLFARAALAGVVWCAMLMCTRADTTVSVRGPSLVIAGALHAFACTWEA